MRVIPAMDLRGGRVVRLRQGDYARETVFGEVPAAQALAFRRDGAGLVHVVDLDGARDGAPAHLSVARALADARVEFQIGGGVRRREDIVAWLEAGASRVIVGSLLVRDPGLAADLLDEFGPRIVAGVDARDGFVATDGWTVGSTVPARELIERMAALGARAFVVTDVATDGMMSGVNAPFLREMSAGLDAEFIASGGVTTLDDLRLLAAIPGVGGAIVGRALYEGAFTLPEAIAAAGGPSPAPPVAL